VRSPGWKAAAVSLCVSIFVIAACGGGAPPQGTGPGASLATGSPQATASRALPTGGSGLPTTAPTQTTAATSTASPAPTSTATSTETATQTPSSGASNALAVSVGNGYACAIISDGTVACWDTAQTYGQDYGQLGNGSTEGSVTPVFAVGITSATAIATSTDDYPHTCAVLADGTIRCWGYNADGELGNGSTVNSAVPLLVSGISNAVGVSAGWHDTCAVLADGTVWCWGQNHSGQLGNGKSGIGADNPNSPVPLQVIGASGATAVKTAGPQADQAYSCALLSDGTMDCWGYSGFISAGVSNPTWGAYWKIPGIAGATAISTADRHVCALINPGTIQCWGYASGAGSNVPTPVTGLSDAVSLSASATKSCAVRSGGDVACWGPYNVTGPPEKVLGIAGATSVSSGSPERCAVLSDGSVTCFGSATPTAVAGLTPGAAVGTPVPSLATLTIGWDGTKCSFDTDSVTAPGNARLVLDSANPAAGNLLSVSDGHSMADVSQFFSTYTGSATYPTYPDWLIATSVVTTGSYGGTTMPSEALVDLTSGTYGAVCFDGGLAGYVVAAETLVVNP
jgi:hypothetical protein